MIAASLLLISWVLVVSQVFAAGADNGVSQAVSLAYPIGDVVVGTIVLFMATRARRQPGAADIPLPLLGGGLVAWAVADKLQHVQVVDDVAAALDESGLPPDSLVLEMTESVLIDDMDRLVGDALTVARTGT